MGRWLEMLSAMLALTWGAWVWYPPHNAFAQSSVFAILDSIADETAWGVLLMTVGLIQLISAWRNQRHIRFGVDALVMATWLWISLLYLLGNPNSTGWIGYITPAAINALALWGTGYHGVHLDAH